MGEIDILNLQVPLLAQFNLPFSLFSLNVFAGPELGLFLTGEKRNDVTSRFAATDTDPARSAIKNDTIDFSKQMETVELGINAGLGFEIKTGDFGAFFIKPGVYIGLTNILEDNRNNDTTVNLSGKHSTIYLTFGYKFNAKPKKGATESDADSENLEIDRKSSKTSEYPSNLDRYNDYKSQDPNSSSSENESSGSGSLTDFESDSSLE
jgi:hypothetical protein